MTFAFNWGGEAGQFNNNSDWSNIAMPVGEWFDMEMRWQFTTGPTGTLSVWINGQLALTVRRENGDCRALRSRVLHQAVRRRPGSHPLEPDPDHQVRAQRPHLRRTHLAVNCQRLLSQRRLRGTRQRRLQVHSPTTFYYYAKGVKRLGFTGISATFLNLSGLAKGGVLQQ